MPVLVIRNFDDDSLKNEWASMETAFSHCFRCSRAANSIVSGLIWPKFELVRDFMHVLVTCKYKKDRIKNNREKVETSFSPLRVNGGFLLPWSFDPIFPKFSPLRVNGGFLLPWSFDPIFPKTLCSLSPTPVMLHINFDQDWPTGFKDIQVWKCGLRTDDGPLVYYKLTLWAFGSGELKIWALMKPAFAFFALFKKTYVCFQAGISTDE